MKTLTEFLDEYAEHKEARAAQVAQKRQEWVEAIERLFRKAEEWIHQADRHKLVLLKRYETEIREEGLGTYAVPALHILLDARQARLVPVAREGLVRQMDEGGPRAQGRVDLTDGGHSYRLYRYLEERGERWILIDDDDGSVKSLDKKVFEDALLSLLG